MTGKQDLIARQMIASLWAGESVVFVAPTKEQCREMLAFVQPALPPAAKLRCTATNYCPPNSSYVIYEDEV